MRTLRGIPDDLAPLFEELVGRADRALYDDMLHTQRPTIGQRRRVLDLLSDEFCRELQPDSEPTARGVRIDDLLGSFLLEFPLDEP